MPLKHTVMQFFKGRGCGVESVLRPVAASRSGLWGLPKWSVLCRTAHHWSLACISNSGDWFPWDETFAKKQVTLLGVLITLVWIKCTWFLQNDNGVDHKMVTDCLYACMHVPFQWDFCHASHHEMVEFISLSFEPGPGQLTSFGQWNIRKCAAEAWKVCLLLLLLETLLPLCGQASLRMRDHVKKGLKLPRCPGYSPRHEREAIFDHSAPNELN